MTQGALTAFDPRPEWSWEPLGYLAPRVAEDGHGDLEPLSVYLGAGVVRRADREDNHNVLGADMDKYLRVLPGDLVFNKLRTWQGGLGASRYEGIVSPAYYVLRPGPRLEPRFAHYVLISTPYLAELTRLSKFMPPSQFDMPWEALKRLPIALPSVEEQRRIADFLDDQVARIGRLRDQLLTLRTRMNERHQTVIDTLTTQGESRRLYPMLYLLRDGTHTPPQRTAVGVPLLTAKNIKASRLVLTAQDTYISESDAADLDRSFAPRARDVLLTVKGSVGNVALVPHEFPRFQIERNIALLRPDEGALRSEWLWWSLQSTRVQDQMKLSMSFSAQPGLYLGSIADLRVAVPGLGAQDEALSALSMVDAERLSIDSASAIAIDLLEERKRALVTAAVTGELDVTTARPIGMGKWVPNVGATVEAPASAQASSIGGIG